MATLTLNPKNPDGTPVNGYATATLDGGSGWIPSDAESFTGTVAATSTTAPFVFTLQPNTGALAGTHYAVNIAGSNVNIRQLVNIPGEGSYHLSDVAVAAAPTTTPVVATGGGLSQEQREKLDSVQVGAEKNVQSDWDQTDTDADDYIKNKPTALGGGLTMVRTDSTIIGDGINTDLSVANPFTAADETKLDGIQAGAEVNPTSILTDATISGDGIITNLAVANPFTSAEKTKLASVAANAEQNVQSDWNATSGDAFIRNKPTIPAAVTSIMTDTTISGNGITNALRVANPFTSADESKLDGIAAGAEVNVQANWTQTSPSHDAYIQNKPTLGPQLPATTGQGGRFAAVNSTGTALVYVAAPSGGQGTTTVLNTYKGAWAVGGSYSIGDIVLFENNLFLTTTAHTATNANAPYTSIRRNANWKPISYPDFLGVADSQSRPANDDRLVFYDQSDTNGVPVKYTTIGNVLNKLSIGTTLTGDGVSTALAVANPFTDDDETKLDGIAAGAQVNVKPDWNAASGTAQEILNKPTIPAAVTSIRTDATITGNGISTDLSVANPFTAADETKLDGIAAGAQVNVKPDWNAASGTAQEILNKPTIPTGGGGSNFKGDWSGTSVAYATGDVVEFRHEFYMCDLAHTSTASNGPTFGADWRTRWHAISGVDIAELGGQLDASTIADGDKVAIADVSTTTDETKYATVSHLTTKIQTGYLKAQCVTRAEYDAIAVKDANTVYLVSA